MLFLYATHHHAQMPRFNHHAYSLRLDGTLDGFCNLHGEAFLDLQSAGKDVYNAGNLAQTNHLAVWDIGHMDFAEERQDMMLAQTEHFYIFNDDHLVVGDLKERAFQYL